MNIKKLKKTVDRNEKFKENLVRFHELEYKIYMLNKRKSLGDSAISRHNDTYFSRMVLKP